MVAYEAYFCFVLLTAISMYLVMRRWTDTGNLGLLLVLSVRSRCRMPHGVSRTSPWWRSSTYCRCSSSSAARRERPPWPRPQGSGPSSFR